MNKKLKNSILLMMSFILLLSLTGCSDKYEKKYQNYVKSLISINYLGAADDYISATGANKEDADALYQSNVELLANNIMTYYGVVITDAPEMYDEFVNLAKNVYSKVNYKVSKAYPSGSVYLVDVTIYPINLFPQTAGEITAYVERFNTAVSNGDYNDYTLSEYETEFTSGMLSILNNGCINMTYADPVTVTVEIIVDGDTYYISERDFLKIDATMISTAVPEIETPDIAN